MIAARRKLHLLWRTWHWPTRVCIAVLVLLALPYSSTNTCRSSQAAPSPTLLPRQQDGVGGRTRVEGVMARGWCTNLRFAETLCAKQGDAGPADTVEDLCVGTLRLKGGGRISRERAGIYTTKKWEQSKVRGGGGVSKKARNVSVHASDKAHKMSKEDKEKLRAKKQSYKELIKRSKKQREDRKRTKMNADALREEIDAGTKLVIVCACAN
jgi:hypothetical protein